MADEELMEQEVAEQSSPTTNVGEGSHPDGPPPSQDLQVGLTPDGFIGIQVRDLSGEVAGYVMTDPGEAGRLAFNLIALGTMMVQSKYAQIFAEREELQRLAMQIQGGNTPNIAVPGRAGWER